MFDNIRYDEVLVTFTEVPDEISLCFNITGCPCCCKGCFEPWLCEDRGDILTLNVLREQLKKHKHITCICFMGGDRYYDDIATLITEFKKEYPNLKFAMYSGRENMNLKLSMLLDYYKVGPFVEKHGPLDKKTTNQRFYKKIDNEWTDLTYRFQEEKQ